MMSDPVALAAAWRARTAAGYAGPVHVRLKPAGHAVTVTRGDVTYTAATYHARYKADAHAEQIARQLCEADPQQNH